MIYYLRRFIQFPHIICSSSRSHCILLVVALYFTPPPFICLPTVIRRFIFFYMPINVTVFFSIEHWFSFIVFHCCRLYLTGQISHIDGSVRSIKRGSVASARSHGRGSVPAEENQGGRTGPIFLRSVVNRQFKYRWVVLGLSAISSMTIIVIVSVVYSNR